VTIFLRHRDVSRIAMEVTLNRLTTLLSVDSVDDDDDDDDDDERMCFNVA